MDILMWFTQIFTESGIRKMSLYFLMLGIKAYPEIGTTALLAISTFVLQHFLALPRCIVGKQISLSTQNIQKHNRDVDTAR